MADNLLQSIMGAALEFATPFAQSVMKRETTPTELQQERVAQNALNGAGANDPTLANQAPLGLLDFLTGARLTGQTQQGTGGLRESSGPNWTFIVIGGIAVVAVFVLLARK